MVCVNDSMGFNENLMINLDDNEFNFQKIDDETYEDKISLFWKIINQITNLNLQNNETIDYVKKLVENLLQTLFKGFIQIHTIIYDNITSISECNAVSYLKTQPTLEDSLLKFVNKIRMYLRDLGKFDNIFVRLQKSPENSDFNLIVLDIKTEFADLEEKLFLSRTIGKLLDEVTDEIVGNRGDEMYDQLSRVTYTIEEINV